MLVRGVVRFVVQIVVHGDASECVEAELIDIAVSNNGEKENGCSNEQPLCVQMVGGEGFEPPTRCL